MRFLFAAAAFAMLAGCATSRPAFDFAPADGVSVHYQGVLDDARETAFTAEPEPGPQGTRVIQLETRLLSFDAAAVRAAFGDEPGVAAWAISPAEAAALAAMGSAISAPRLAVLEGQFGTLTLNGGERAYISGFGLTGEGATLIVDPMVATVEGDSLEIRVQAGLTDGAVKLKLAALTQSLVLPMPEARVMLRGREVTVQRPMRFSQSLFADGTVPAGQVLVLTGLVAPDGALTVLLISAAEAATTE